MTVPLKRFPFWVTVIGVLCASPLSARADDVVLHWDDIAVRIMTTQPLVVTTPATPVSSPFAQARFAAIVQLAVFEAVNATSGNPYAPYLGSPVAPGGPIVAPLGASADAAAVAAAHAVLVDIFKNNPTVVSSLNAERDTSLAAIPNGAPKTSGIMTGQAAAAALIALRASDGSSPLTFYHPPSPLALGEWDATLPPLGNCGADASGNPLGGILYNWPNVKPFGIVQPDAPAHWTDDFLPKAPPDITSNQYAKDYNDVKRIGSWASTERPDDRTLVARFYAAQSTTAFSHQVARQLAAARGDSMVKNARTLALMSMATNDAFAASFATKYHYLLWRPVTAIRTKDFFNKHKVESDPDWVPLIPTPCFPSYPSNHASGSNAALEVLRRTFGAAGFSVSITGTVPALTVPGVGSLPSPGVVTLHYSKLKDISNDIDDARVYGGIHYWFDQEAGLKLGVDVAKTTIKGNLQGADD